MNLASAKYRITYEAFSKFSGGLNKVENLETLINVIGKHLKYLFNFKIFRILIIDNEDRSSYTFAKGQIWTHTSILNFEQNLLIHQIPFKRPLSNYELPDFLDEIPLLNGQLWGWYLKYSDYDVCVSVVSDDLVKFSYSDVEIVHLLADTVTSKFRQISLNEEIKLKNERLEEAVAQIEIKNKEIEKINSNQQNIINSHTRELRIKNKKLLELTRLNAHNLREPLCRVLGLLEISGFYSDEELRTEILPRLIESSLDLDTIFKKVVSKSEEDIKNYSADFNIKL